MADAGTSNRLTQLLVKLRASAQSAQQEQPNVSDLEKAASELSIKDGMLAIETVFAEDEIFAMPKTAQVVNARKFLREMLFIEHPEREKRPAAWPQHIGSVGSRGKNGS